jgi:hypothetical protein
MYFTCFAFVLKFLPTKYFAHKQRFVVTQTMLQTEIPALIDKTGYKHTFCQNVESTNKLHLFMFS